jgi:hypothetical protein
MKLEKSSQPPASAMRSWMSKLSCSLCFWAVADGSDKVVIDLDYNS